MTSGPRAPFGHVLTAMTTAFEEDGSLDLDGTARIAAHLIDHGHDGLVVLGTTGEAPTISSAEAAEVVRAVRDAVGDRATIVVGVGTNDTPNSVARAVQAEKLGADGLLLVTPYYSKPSQPGILHHFRQVIEATDVPVMLYDVPGRVGTAIHPETYARAAELPTVVAVKDAVGDFARGVALMRDTGLAFYSGDDAQNLGWLAHGGCGFVSVAGHACGPQLKELADAYFSGDHAAALGVFTRMLPAIDAIMCVPSYGATTAKAVMQLRGVLTNRAVRSPLVPLDDEEFAALRAGLSLADLI
jgi:4-hydroxy-tetrahydrodipicolinate synthase